MTDHPDAIDPAESAAVSIPPPPGWTQVGDDLAPAAPTRLADAGLDAFDLCDLALRAANSVSRFDTDWAARRLHISRPLMGEILERLSGDSLLDVLGQGSSLGYRYSISNRGRERAAHLLEHSGYVGPAPVTLESYAAALMWQLARTPAVTPEHMAQALDQMVIPADAVQLAGLAASSGRSLFLFGPSGNGKSSLGRAIHEAFAGDLWIPHCIAVDGSVIRLFDPHCHHPAASNPAQPWVVDRRWIKIRRPLIVAGGEMTIDSLDLSYIPSMRSYEAPLHLKANGGTFLIDDFGRQRVDPHELLNRWIIPMEHRLDYLTLRTGQKIEVPLRQMLIIATNLDLEGVTDPAFLRRIGYRLYLGTPTPEAYASIFRRHAARHGLGVEDGLMDRIGARYRDEGRELRCCEPRDLIDRCLEICEYRGLPKALSEDVLGMAWAGYFGERKPDPQRR